MKGNTRRLDSGSYGDYEVILGVLLKHFMGTVLRDSQSSPYAIQLNSSPGDLETNGVQGLGCRFRVWG